MKPLIPVVLAGGVGSRLWPLSRAMYPKPFHALFGERSLLQNTALRARAVTGRPPIVVCSEANRFLVAEQLRALNLAWLHIVLEPEGRNTAPAIALGAYMALREAPDAQLLVLPADHLIDDGAGFAEAVRTGVTASTSGAVVVFGVVPNRAETGYGYIELDTGAGHGVQPVRAFVEKPDRKRAEDFLASGQHLWNSGMFLTDARIALEEMKAHSRELVDAVAESVRQGRSDLEFFRPGEAFLQSPMVSFDVAVMEKTSRAAALPVEFGWNDVGSWESVLEASGPDGQGNHFVGDVLSRDVNDTLIHAGHRLVSAIGVDRLIIVETTDAVLIANRERAQDVTMLVGRLQDSKRSEHLQHPKVYRPWGSFEGVGRCERYQVKRIRIKPGASISLQKHRYRAEHWVVVRGYAEVTRGDEVFTLRENESTYIPQGVKHRLGNAGEHWLEIIEVQIGSYVGEDDIERYEDLYGRVRD